MFWSGSRFHSLNLELRKVFGKKMIKLALDGGFSCPNRDGTIDTHGCLFCSDAGSGDFAGDRNLPLTQQISQQIELLRPKWPTGGYIGYFQNFTGTWDLIQNLETKYNEVLSHPLIEGMAIATRPDAFSRESVELLKNINNETYLWLELGLQTVHDGTATLIRRGFTTEYFESVFYELKKMGFRIVFHIIVGLPGETKVQIMETIDFIARLRPWGIKIHLMHILKDTDLHEYFLKTQFKIYGEQEYIDTVVEILEKLPPEIVIHRITGDAPKELLVAPRWSLNKRAVLNGVAKKLLKKDSYQGIEFKVRN